MALTRKPGAQSVVSPSIDLPDDMPRLPEDVRKRFPSLEKYEADMVRWWYDVRKALQRQQAANAELLTELKARIDSLNANP